MTRNEALEKINKCISPATNVAAADGEKQNAWAMAEKLASKYGFKIVKREASKATDINTAKKEPKPAEYTVYDYQKDFYKAFEDIIQRKKRPVIVGGTGMYLDAIIRDYKLVNLEEDEALHAELESTPLEVLCERLLKEQPDLHVKADLQEKERVIKAIEIIEAKKRGNDTTSDYRPDINPFIIGTTLNRELLWQNISIRLKERLDEGMLDEVSSIHEDGISWERLEKLGLEYRYCSLFLQGKIATKDELFEQLFIAIRQFSKRQQTWFRMMEKKGVKIHWLEPASKEERINQALQLISKESFD